MPRKKRATKIRLENLQKARKAKLSQSKLQALASQLSEDSQRHPSHINLDRESNDSHITGCPILPAACAPSSGLDSERESVCQQFSLSPAVQECGDELEGRAGRCLDKESNLQDSCRGPEITEESKLDHFVAVLQEAQRVAVETQREKDKQGTRPKTYTRKSKTTLWRYKKHQDDLMTQGYLPVFDFITHIKKKKRHKELFRPLAPETTRPEEIVIEEQEVEAADGGNGPEDNSTFNPMCNTADWPRKLHGHRTLPLDKLANIQ